MSTRKRHEPLQGIQTWVRLPPGQRDGEAAFDHFAAESLPLIEYSGVSVRVVAGALGTVRSPVPIFRPLTYLDVQLQAGAQVLLPVAADHELAVYVAIGSVAVARADSPVEAGTLALLVDGGATLELSAPVASRAIVIGGTPLPEPTTIWWNFVADSVEQGRRLQTDWEAGRFPRMPETA